MDKSKEAIWRSRLSKAEEYSGSIVEFCKTEGLSIHSFNYWKHKLAPNRGDQILVSKPFARVEVQERDVESQQISLLPDPKWLAEVILHLQRGSR